MQVWLTNDAASKKLAMHRALIYSAVTVFVLFMFQPFGTHGDDMAFKYLRLSGYGLVTFCALLLAGMLEIKLADKRLSAISRRTIIVALYILLLALFNHSYFVVAILGQWHWQNQLAFVFYTVVVASFPIGFLYLINRHSKSIAENQQPSSAMKEFEFTNEANNEANNDSITFIGDNKGEQLKVSLSALLFIKASDNYCEITTSNNNQIHKQLLRCTLNQLLTQIPGSRQIERCHRSFAVNVAKVTSYAGNASGLQLTMQDGEESVPVSRTYVKQLKASLAAQQ